MRQLQSNLEIADGQSLVAMVGNAEHEALADSTIEQHARNILVSENKNVICHVHSSAEQKKSHTETQLNGTYLKKSTLLYQEGDA